VNLKGFINGQARISPFVFLTNSVALVSSVQPLVTWRTGNVVRSMDFGGLKLIMLEVLGKPANQGAPPQELSLMLELIGCGEGIHLRASCTRGARGLCRKTNSKRLASNTLGVAYGFFRGKRSGDE